MNKISKILAVSCAVAMGTFAVAGSADAQEWHRHHGGGGDAVAAGIAGLALGAIAGAAIASPGPRYYAPDDDYYYAPPPPPRVYYRTTYVRPAPVYVGGGLRPWSPEWYRYCENRYRTFDARSGTFIGNDGRSHFCAAY